jgi:hypothetical protein
MLSSKPAHPHKAASGGEGVSRSAALVAWIMC